MLRFRWIWEEGSTHVPYQHEVGALPFLLGGKNAVEKNSLKSARLVLGSLTPNARSIFNLLAETHIKIHSEMNNNKGEEFRCTDY